VQVKFRFRSFAKDVRARADFWPLFARIFRQKVSVRLAVFLLLGLLTPRPQILIRLFRTIKCFDCHLLGFANNLVAEPVKPCIVGWHLLQVAIMFGLLAVPLEFEFGQMNIPLFAARFDALALFQFGIARL
jgi:hypothetical protein